MAVTDDDQRFQAISDEYAALLGYTAAELVGRLALELVDEHPALVATRLAELKRNGRHAAVVTLIRKDGARITLAYRMRRSLESRLWVTEAHLLDGKLNTHVDLSKDDAAGVAGVTVRTIERWIANNELPAHGRRGSVRIRLHDLERLLTA